MTLSLSHFTLAVLFAVFASVVFGITKRSGNARAGPLWSLLLCHVCWRGRSGRLGYVVPAPLSSCYLLALTFPDKRIQYPPFRKS